MSIKPMCRVAGELIDMADTASLRRTAGSFSPKFLDHGQLKLPLTRAGSETDSFLLKRKQLDHAGSCCCYAAAGGGGSAWMV
jgi:hypothetical protein